MVCNGPLGLDDISRCPWLTVNQERREGTAGTEKGSGSVNDRTQGHPRGVLRRASFSQGEFSLCSCDCCVSLCCLSVCLAVGCTVHEHRPFASHPLLFSSVFFLPLPRTPHYPHRSSLFIRFGLVYFLFCLLFPSSLSPPTTYLRVESSNTSQSQCLSKVSIPLSLLSFFSRSSGELQLSFSCKTSSNYLSYLPWLE